MNQRSLVALAAGLTLAGGCSSGAAPTAPPGVVRAVSSVSAWGSLLAQLGGAHVQASSLLTNPDADPHSYEPTPADARSIADASLVVENGIGYDPWLAQALAAEPDPRRVVIVVGKVVGIPDGGNPHRWYAPSDVTAVASAIAVGLSTVDPADAGYFADRLQSFQTRGLARYHQLVHDIRARYAGTPVGASESIASPLAQALGLDLLTPPAFLRAISEGTDPSAADKAAIDAQISRHRIAVYLVNSQNSTPDVTAQVDQARAAGIPVTSITETLAPAAATFQDWQCAQLEALQAALHQATGR